MPSRSWPAKRKVRAHAARPADEAHERHHGHALARARFADDAEHLALFQREAHAVDRMHHAALRGKLDVQVFDFDGIQDAEGRRKRRGRKKVRTEILFMFLVPFASA
jgi:hypothetical protein